MRYGHEFGDRRMTKDSMVVPSKSVTTKLT
jgi:hypothetical protein